MRCDGGGPKYFMQPVRQPASELAARPGKRAASAYADAKYFDGESTLIASMKIDVAHAKHWA